MSSLGPFQPLVDLIMTPPGIIITVVIGIILFYYYFLRKPPQDKFEIETFADVVADDLDDKFKIKGIKSNASVVQGFDYIGDVDKWIHEKGKHIPMVYDPKEDRFREDKSKEAKPVEYDHFIFRIYNSFFLLKWFGLGAKKYVIIDSKFLTNVDNRSRKILWNISNTVQLVRWGNVFISSEAGEEYLTDIAIKRSHENTLTFLMNYSRKIIYLEMKHAKVMDYKSTTEKIKSKNWREYKQAEGFDEPAENEE